MTEAQFASIRSQRSLHGPTDRMVADLKAGIVTPVTSLAKLTVRYGSEDEHRTMRFFREALCIHAEAVGSVLVATDVNGEAVYGQVPDPRTLLESPEMQSAGQSLADVIAKNVKELRYLVDPKTRATARREEYLVMPMPCHHYELLDGNSVYAYGQYFFSLYLDHPAEPLSTAPRFAGPRLVYSA
jgi:hypothetical protein